jgi:Domain of unknown function (DUF5658)
MSSVALTSAPQALAPVSGSPYSHFSTFCARLLVRPSPQVLVLGALVALLQLLDGILTGIGVSLMGSHAEGNALLRMLMEQLGYIPALVVAKSVAIVVLIVLCLLAREVRWITQALQCVIVLYLAGAIIPWSTILLARAF